MAACVTKSCHTNKPKLKINAKSNEYFADTVLTFQENVMQIYET